MPQINLRLDIPQTEYDELEAERIREGLRSVRSLLTWTMRSDIAERAHQALLAHRRAIAAPTETAAA